MTGVTLEKVLKQVKTLTTDEQRRLREFLDALLANPPAASIEDEVERELFQLGFLSEIKPPITDLTPYRNRPLAKVKGKPASEIIIEERR